MDDRTFGAEITEVPDEVRLRLTGDLNSRADETLANAYAQVVRPRPAPGQPRFRARGLHQQHGHRARRPAAWPTRDGTVDGPRDRA